MTGEPFLKPVIWIGSSRKDLRVFPEHLFRIIWAMLCTLRSAVGCTVTRNR